MKTVFLRLLDAEDKSEALRSAIRQPVHSKPIRRFVVDPTIFSTIPRSPFAYWVDDRLMRLFAELPAFEGQGRIARKGLTTSDDTRYVRNWWEPRSAEIGETWAPYAKGGSVRLFHCDLSCVVRWDWLKRTIPGYIGRPGRETPVVECADLMGRPGLTWPLRAACFSPSALPERSVFSARGYVIQAPKQDLMALLALTSSSSFDALFKMCLGRAGHPEFIVGVLQRLPLPEPSQYETQRSRLASLAQRAWSLRRSLDTRSETSHAFVLPALLQMGGETLVARANAWTDRSRTIDEQVEGIQAEINAICAALYGIVETDRNAITEGLGTNEAAEPSEFAEEVEEDDADSRPDDDPKGLASELISWAIGVAFGRFDLRSALSDPFIQREPEPFAPLPACSPAMLRGGDGLPVSNAESGYPIAFPTDGILVDDPGHPRDLTSALRSIFATIFKSNDDDRWIEARDLLDPNQRSLTEWLATDFFEQHIKQYSKNRRKAPIFWQLSVPSSRYSIWLYAHRLGRDSFVQIQNDVLAPKLAHEERQLASLREGTPAKSSAKERKDIEVQETFVDELRGLLDEVKRVAPLWSPLLEDGVVLTMAPLWRLVPQHKAWQKELKSKWDELAAGKYDWAHLAMHLWPERVIPKCSEDRSLAIAQGLEDVFWFEDEEGKWKPYDTPKRSIVDLVSERASAAVKAALKNLLEAPESISAAKRGRKSKAA